MSLAITPSDMKKTAVTMRTGAWSLRNLIDALSETAEKQRGWIHSRENLEDFIAGVVMRLHIAQVAKQEKLDTGPSYTRAVEYAFDSYLLTTLEDSLRKQMTFSTDSLRAYFVHNRDRFASPPKVRLSGILLETAGFADSVKQLLIGGEPFDVTARRFSVQQATAGRGGDLGYFRREDLGPLANEFFALRPGEWKGPFTDDGKYLFVKCTDIKSPVYRSFEESAREVQETLASMAWVNVRTEYVGSCKKSIPCRVYPERLMAISLSSLQ
jgi:parvulin-like peptidyl-prolyl isomerase